MTNKITYAHILISKSDITILKKGSSKGLLVKSWAEILEKSSMQFATLKVDKDYQT